MVHSCLQPLVVGEHRQASEAPRGALKGPAPDQWPAMSKTEKAPEASDKGQELRRLCVHREGQPRGSSKQGQPQGWPISQGRLHGVLMLGF